MKEIVFNLGTGNMPQDKNNIERVNHSFTYLFGGVAHVQTAWGEYNGERELTYVISLSPEYPDFMKRSFIEFFLQALCKVFNQECIAYKVGTTGGLVYNPEYDGERMEFDEQYFINPF